MIPLLLALCLPLPDAKPFFIYKWVVGPAYTTTIPVERDPLGRYSLQRITTSYDRWLVEAELECER